MSKLNDYLEAQIKNTDEIIQNTKESFKLSKDFSKAPIVRTQIDILDIAIRGVKQKNVAVNNVIKHESAMAKYGDKYSTILHN